MKKVSVQFNLKVDGLTHAEIEALLREWIKMERGVQEITSIQVNNILEQRGDRDKL